MRLANRCTPLALILAAALAGGCSDDKVPVLVPTCEIVSPADGAFIPQEQDVNAAADGIQVDVAVRTTNASGGQVTLRVDGDDLAPASVGADGSASFAAVTLPAGPTTSTLTCRVTAGGQTAQGADARVLVGPSCGLRFIPDLGAQAISRADTYRGPDGRPTLDVVVEADGVEAGSVVTLEVGDAGQARTFTATLSPDRATFSVPLTQGTSTRFAASAAGLRCQPKTEVRAAVELGDCRTAVVPATGTSFGIAADQSSTRAGLQTQLCVETECADGSNAFLQIDSGAEQRVAVAAGRACFDATLSEGSRTIKARVQGATQSGTATDVTYCVDLVAPTVSVGVPTSGAILRVAQDRDPSTPNVLDLQVEGTTAGTATTGCTLARPADAVEIYASGSLQARFAPTANGNFTRVVRLAQGPGQILVCAVDQVGNRGCASPVDVTVDLNQPTLAIASPVGGVNLLAADDPDPSTPAREVDVVVTAQGLTAGTEVQLDVDDGRYQCRGNLQTSGATIRAQIRIGNNCPALPDGWHVLVARANDSAGAVAISQEVRILVDNTPPKLRFTEPRASALVYGHTVDVVLATDAEDGQTVTLRGGGSPITAVVRGGGAIFAAVPVAVGTNTLEASVTDAAGNTGSAPSRTFLAAAAPARDLNPTFTAPTDGATLAASADADGDLSNGLQFDVAITVPATTVRATLQVNGGSVVSQAVALGTTSARFTGVTLAEGDNQLVASAFDSGQGRGAASIKVKVATDRLVVTIVSPFDGAVLSGAADADPATEGFQLPVVVATNATAPITSCSIVTNPGAANSQTSTLTVVGRRCSGVVTLPAGATTLVAVVQADRAGRSRPAVVTLDARRPVLSFVTPAPASSAREPVVFNATAQDGSGRAGFQLDVVVEADVIEAGAESVLLVQSPGVAVPTRYTARFDGNRRATFVDVTLPGDAESSLIATAIDRAGNESLPVALPVLVDRTPPSIAITSPTEGALLGVSDDEDSGPNFGTTVTVVVSGAEPGQAVVLRATKPNGGDLYAEDVRVLSAADESVDFTAFSIPMTESGAVALTATVSDRAGNAATAVATFRVDLDAGEVRWFSPSALPSPTLLCSSQDLDPNTAGVQFNTSFRTTGFVNGAVVQVRDGQNNVVGRGTVSAGSVTVVTTLPEGEADYVLTASAVRPSGNRAVTTDTRTIRVDTVAPSITSFACDGDRNGDGFLNASENRVSATDHFEMNCTVGFADATMNGRTVRILSTAPAVGTVVGSATVTNQTATILVSLVGGASPVGHQLSISATDVCNNAALPATGVQVTKSYTVDIVAPTVTITAPSPGLLLAANDRTPAPPRANGLILECCVGPSGPYDITAQVTGAPGGAAVVKLNGLAKGAATVGQDGVVRFPNVGLDQGAVSVTVEVVDAAGNVGVSGTVALTVDSLPPTIAVTSPTNNQQLASNTVTISVTYSDVEIGRGVEIRRRNQGSGGTGSYSVAGSGSTSASGTLSVETVLPQGFHELQAVVSDANGNVGASTPITVEVTASNPVVSFEKPAGNPAVFNAASGTPSGGGLAVDIVVQTGAPIGSSTVLLKNGAQIAGPILVVDVSGIHKATFAGIVLGATETGTLQARVTTALGDFTSVVVPFTVDIAAPSLSFSSPVCKAVFKASDADAQGRLSFTFATDAENGQTVTLVSDVATGTFTGSVAAGAATIGPVALPQGDNVLTASVSDRAGNQRVTTCTTTIDVLPPTIPTFTATRSPSRRSLANLSWTMPGDDGTTGFVASYQLVQKLCALGTTCSITTDGDFTSATPIANPPAITAGGTAMTFDVVIPLQRQITFAMRATDDAGNVSSIVSATVTNTFTDDTLAGPTGETGFGQIVRVADVDNDGLPDLIIGRPGVSSNAGAIRIVYGNGRAPTDVTAAQVGLSGSTRFGRQLDRVGDVDGDGFEDIIVGAPGIAVAGCTAGTSAQTGAAFIFFGGPNGLRAPASTATLMTACASGGSADCFVGVTPPTADAASQVCSFGQGVAGLGNLGAVGGALPFFGVTASDLSISSTRLGKAFVYQLSGTRPALTTTLMTTVVGGADDYHFGSALCAVRDVNGDGVPDFVVGVNRRGQTPPLPGRAYLFLGGSRFASAGGNVTVVNGGAALNDGIIKFGDQIGGDSFGNECRAAGDLDGDGRNDFIINASGGPQLGFYVVKGRSDLDTVAPPTLPSVANGFISVTVAALPGASVPGEIDAGYDIDGDGRPDVVIGDKTVVWVFGGDSVNIVNPVPIATFDFTGSQSVSTGIPVAMIPNWKNATANEAALPDLGFGLFTGPSVVVKY